MGLATGKSSHARWISIAAIALVLISVVRVVSTYHVFSQFWDEPAHIACGLEWWQNGVYRVEPQHPPLARIFAAALLYFKGARLSRFGNLYDDGNAILAAQGQYAWNLTLARLGTLPFWIMSCALMFAIGRRMYGNAAALWALLLYSTLPPVLGYAGLAYTDMALTAGILFFAWRWAEFVRRPGLRNAAWLGVSMAFALLSKYSAIPYIALAVALTGGFALWGKKIPRPTSAALLQWGRVLLCIGVTAFLLMWAGFRFSLVALGPPRASAHATADAQSSRPGLSHPLAYIHSSLRLPLTEVYFGLRMVRWHVNHGHPSYTFGKLQRAGSFYYFPALLVLTIPVGLTVLMILGGIGLRPAAVGGWTLAHWALLAVPSAVLLVNALSTINIGFRHNLAVYPFVCLIGGVGCATAWLRPRRIWRVLIVALVAEHLVSSALAHPDYATYFNFLAGPTPEEICVNSREGGDMWRLASRLKQSGADHLCLVPSQPLPMDVFGLPPYTLLDRNTPCQGWVAVGVMRRRVDLANPDLDAGLAWLWPYTPERIGTSILLYHIP